MSAVRHRSAPHSVRHSAQPGGPLDFGLPPDLVPLLLILAVAAAVAVVWNRERHKHVSRAVGNADMALSVLRERYARGEIDRDDFHQRRRDLEEQRIEEVRGANAR